MNTTDDQLKHFWRAMKDLVEEAATKPRFPEQLRLGNTREAVEKALHELRDPKTNKPMHLKLPATWSVRFDECFQRYLMMPDDTGRLWIVQVPLLPDGKARVTAACAYGCHSETGVVSFDRNFNLSSNRKCR